MTEWRIVVDRWAADITGARYNRWRLQKRDVDSEWVTAWRDDPDATEAFGVADETDWLSLPPGIYPLVPA